MSNIARVTFCIILLVGSVDGGLQAQTALETLRDIKNLNSELSETWSDDRLGELQTRIAGILAALDPPSSELLEDKTHLPQLARAMEQLVHSIEPYRLASFADVFGLSVELTVANNLQKATSDEGTIQLETTDGAPKGDPVAASELAATAPEEGKEQGKEFGALLSGFGTTGGTDAGSSDGTSSAGTDAGGTGDSGTAGDTGTGASGTGGDDTSGGHSTSAGTGDGAGTATGIGSDTGSADGTGDTGSATSGSTGSDGTGGDPGTSSDGGTGGDTGTSGDTSTGSDTGTGGDTGDGSTGTDGGGDDGGSTGSGFTLLSPTIEAPTIGGAPQGPDCEGDFCPDPGPVCEQCQEEQEKPCSGYISIIPVNNKTVAIETDTSEDDRYRKIAIFKVTFVKSKVEDQEDEATTPPDISSGIDEKITIPIKLNYADDDTATPPGESAADYSIKKEDSSPSSATVSITGVDGEIVFPAGETEVILVVEGIKDDEDEEPETFSIEVGKPTTSGEKRVEADPEFDQTAGTVEEDRPISCRHFIHTPIDDGSVLAINATVAGASLSVSLPAIGTDKSQVVEVGTPQLVTVQDQNGNNFDDYFSTFVQIGFWEPVRTAQIYIDEEGCEHWTVSVEIEAWSRFVDSFRRIKRRGIVFAIDCDETTFSADFSGSSWELIEDALLDPAEYADFPGAYEQLESLVQAFESSLGDPTAALILPSCSEQCE